jgi:hypothetical protein
LDRQETSDQEQYDTVSANVEIEPHHPPGLIMHGPAEVDGKVEVAQIWDAPEYAERFDEELKPALEAAGVSLDPSVTVYELHHLGTP